MKYLQSSRASSSWIMYSEGSSELSDATEDLSSSPSSSSSSELLDAELSSSSAKLSNPSSSSGSGVVTLSWPSSKVEVRGELVESASSSMILDEVVSSIVENVDCVFGGLFVWLMNCLLSHNASKE